MTCYLFPLLEIKNPRLKHCGGCTVSNQDVAPFPDEIILRYQEDGQTLAVGTIVAILKMNYNIVVK